MSSVKPFAMLQHNFSDFLLETGTDEAGRGCLAGPVTAAAVTLPIFRSAKGKNKNKSVRTFYELINDSKLLTEKTRERLKPIIEEIAINFAVTHLEPLVIDEINILNASIKAMQECVLKLEPQPEYVIVDGNAPFIHKNGIKNKAGKIYTATEIAILTSIPSTSIVQGDGKFTSIAAASVLAKTYRDEYMNRIHEEYPMYNWKQNKGYPTKEHREAIRKYGVTKYHRMSFRLLPEQYSFDFEINDY